MHARLRPAALVACTAALLSPSEALLSSHAHVVVHSAHATLSVSRGFPKTTDGSDTKAARRFEEEAGRTLAAYSAALEAGVPDLAKKGFVLQPINRKSAPPPTKPGGIPQAGPQGDWERIPSVARRSLSADAARNLGAPRLADTLAIEVSCALAPPLDEAALRAALVALMDPRGELFRP